MSGSSSDSGSRPVMSGSSSDSGSRPVMSGSSSDETHPDDAWLEGWWALLPGDRDRRRFTQGRAFWRSGRVSALRVGPGRLSGHVQGSRATPYLVEALLPPLDDDTWELVITQIAGELRFSARLLAGHLPADLPGVLSEEHGIALLGRSAELDPRCACGEASRPCAHLVALWEAASAQFANDPFALLRLRGRGRERLLGELAALRRRARRAEDVEGVPLGGLEDAALGGTASSQERVSVPGPVPPATPAGPIRLLGDPPGWAGGVSAVDVFAPLVLAAADAAEELQRRDDED